MNFWDRPLTTIESLIIIAAIVLLILLLLWRARRASRKVAKEFLEQHPHAAVLYLYVQDVPNNDGRAVCQHGTTSKVFDAKDAPGFGVAHGAAYYLIPGYVEFDATVSWTKDYYLIKRRHQMQAHFSLQAEPDCAYAAVFDEKKQKEKIIKLDKKAGD